MIILAKILHKIFAKFGHVFTWLKKRTCIATKSLTTASPTNKHAHAQQHAQHGSHTKEKATTCHGCSFCATRMCSSCCVLHVTCPLFGTARGMVCWMWTLSGPFAHLDAMLIANCLHAHVTSCRSRARHPSIMWARSLTRTCTHARAFSTLNRVSARITQPKAQGASQAMLYGVGLTEKDMNKAQVSRRVDGCAWCHIPCALDDHSLWCATLWSAMLWHRTCACAPLLQVGISSMWYEGNPCNAHLRGLGDAVKAGVTQVQRHMDATWASHVCASRQHMSWQRQRHSTCVYRTRLMYSCIGWSCRTPIQHHRCEWWYLHGWVRHVMLLSRAQIVSCDVMTDVYRCPACCCTAQSARDVDAHACVHVLSGVRRYGRDVVLPPIAWDHRRFHRNSHACTMVTTQIQARVRHAMVLSAVRATCQGVARTCSYPCPCPCPCPCPLCRYDANISIPGCDKNMPGCLIAMARVNRPSIMVRKQGESS